MADSNSPRIAIKFGGAASSRPKPPSSLGKRHRAQAIHDDSDSDAEDGNEAQHEEITGYGPGGAKNNDHRRQHRRERSSSYEERRRRSTSRSRYSDRKGQREEKHARRNEETREVDPGDEDKPIQYGLTINKKSDRQSSDKSQAGSRRDDDRSDDERGRKKIDRGPRTVDEEAMDALLGDEPKKRRYNSDDPVNEYRSMPIEDFGASLLRNLGWDGNMKGKSKAVEPRKHGNLTGLGSKNAKEAEDLGAWEQKKPKSRRLDDYRREEDARRRRREERQGDTSYKRERERERERDRDRHREKR